MQNEDSRDYMIYKINILLARSSNYMCEYDDAKEFYQEAIDNVKKFIQKRNYKYIFVLFKLYIEYFFVNLKSY